MKTSCELRVSSCELKANAARPSLATRNSQLATRPAFTLIEMITVLTIIIIVLAIAIPIWDALMNGTNVSAAQNQISAFLANARADAIYNRQQIGVFFYLDQKSGQFAMAEVQVQPLYWSASPPGSVQGTTPLFWPGTWTAGPTPAWSASNIVPYTNDGPVYSLELVNNPDPNSPGNYIFYRDPVLLPKGVGVVLNSNTYGYNLYNVWSNNSTWDGNNPNAPALDRYQHLGCIMFNSDGTLASIPIGIPYYETFYNGQPNAPQESQLCSRIGMYSNNNNYLDFGSIVNNSGNTPAVVPLMSSPGLVIFDHDAYLAQHCNPTQVMSDASGTPTETTIGGGNPPAQFGDADLEISTSGTIGTPPTTTPPAASSLQAGDKFLEESWIDQNGIAFLVNPSDGSLIRSK
jgi:type II secretory pathway pseudopilin PulG